MKPPKIEKTKSRFVEGNAFIDYPVSETVIYPDYHNNRTELTKIKSTIDSVKLDEDITITSIHIKGYASPESPYENNTMLAKGRTEAIKKYVLDMYAMPDTLIMTDFEPENWAGLREYLVKSSLPYKNNIIRIIDKDEEPDRKEWIIKSTYKDDYKYLVENCYPFLRRTYYRVEYEIHSFTDIDHIMELIKTRPQKLNLEEFYLAAENLEPESAEFQEVFDVAVRMYPEDKIANLNAANVAMQRKDFKSAAGFIERAGDSPEAVYAKGVYEALQGNYTEAGKHFRKAETLGIYFLLKQLFYLDKIPLIKCHITI
jgi:tetratricopeptide (TPR) repeat protein